ncbi:MAG TPA: hypothetical protein VGL68_01420 [Solirubrobacteraceae bacterium]
MNILRTPLLTTQGSPAPTAEIPSKTAIFPRRKIVHDEAATNVRDIALRGAAGAWLRVP